MEEYIVGIDFGACNLKAAGFDGKKFRTIQLNADASGIKHSPNFILYRKKKKSDGVEKIIGQIAVNNSMTDTQGNYVSGIKRKMEISNWSKEIPVLNKNVTAQEIISDIFGCMKKYFKPGKDQNIRAALTVPVAFSKVQRKIIRQAAENSGFAVDSLISEPFAALMSLKNLSDYDGKLIMIFDFGGSTLDISVSKIETSNDGGLKIKEQAAAGIKFGGLDIDRDIYEKILLRDYKENFDSALQNFTNREEKFLAFTQSMKEALFKGGDDEIESDDIDNVPEGLNEIILKKDDVEKMFSESGYKEKIFDMLDALFDDLADSDDFYQKEDVTKIFPFGGTSQIPFFVNLLEEYFGSEIFKKEDFNFQDNKFLTDGLESRYLSMAGGAVKYLMSKIDGSKIETENVIPYCLGYAQDGKFKRVLNRNMPFSYTKTTILSLKDLKKNNWEFSIYQCFNNQNNIDITEEGTAVFVEKIKLNSSLYEKKDSPILEMRMRRDGKLQLRFFEYRNFDNGKKKIRESVQVEEHLIDMGG